MEKACRSMKDLNVSHHQGTSIHLSAYIHAPTQLQLVF